MGIGTVARHATGRLPGMTSVSGIGKTNGAGGGNAGHKAAAESLFCLACWGTAEGSSQNRSHGTLLA